MSLLVIWLNARSATRSIESEVLGGCRPHMSCDKNEIINWIKNLSDAERWFYGICAGLITIFIVHRLALRRERIGARRKAAEEFRRDILTALPGIYLEPARWPDDIDATLREAFPKLQDAVEKFRPCVPWWNRKAFDMAWFRYRCGTGREIDVQNYFHYIGFSSNPNPKGTFRRNVDTLLAFAKIR